MAAAHGVHVRVAPNLGLHEGIDAVRAILPPCWFDERKCHAGLEALTFYQKTYNERYRSWAISHS